jgi:hypothetical protein
MQLSLLERSRASHSMLSDTEHVALIAASVVRELGQYPPISLAVIASYRAIAEIRVEPMSWAGTLTRESTGFVMRLRAGDSRRRRRFSGFHEVGHTFLPGYADVTQYRCQPETHQRRTVDNETLCDTAASEFLLPRQFVAADLVASDFGLDTVNALADKYDASVQACAHRFVQLWPEPALLVLLEPQLKPTESSDPGAEKKLRVVWAHGEGGWSYVPRYKSAAGDGVLNRALEGEIVDEQTTLAELACDDENVDVSTRVFHYRDQDGELRPQVLALYRRTSRMPARRS